ncbi:hypothetical protein TNIN_139911 [Trichonephila inaurata madagascariensis]|uniref:Uncharacterized protein n=1 Tax=Trichonephila inaurata madagascariensis TaxID=2747483 RepID=A0A8X6XRR7_9ARAC|nr:hypothetical protein TNIN_139911 [Trichonephila inaurata madagascariensis]
MADILIAEVIFYLFSYLVGTFFQGHEPSFFQIIGYVFIAEITKNYILSNLPDIHNTHIQRVSNTHIQRDDRVEPDDKNVIETKPIPVVQSLAVFKICEALEINVRFVPTDKMIIWATKNKLLTEKNPIIPEDQAKGKKQKKSIPEVYNDSVYRMCIALGLVADLNPEKETAILVQTFQKQRKQKLIPVVQSPTVFMICKALNLHAVLAQPEDVKY